MRDRQLDPKSRGAALFPRRWPQAGRGPQVELARVEPLASAEREEVELVAVVPHQQDSRVDLFAVDARMQPITFSSDGEQRLCPRERLCAAAVMLAPVHEACVGAEGHVVEEESSAHPADVDALDPAAVEGGERRERIVTVEAGVACEVVARSEGDADEARAGLERGRRDRGERSVAARDAHDLGSRPDCELAGILTGPQEMRRDPPFARGRGQLVRGRISAAGAGVDQQKGVGPHGRQVEPNGPWRPSRPMSIIPA